MQGQQNCHEGRYILSPATKYAGATKYAVTPAFDSRLLAFYNRSWQLGRLPLRRKTAVIVPIPKRADPDNPCPISLLSVVDKELMVLLRLTWKIGPMHSHVRAYLQGRCTTDWLVQFIISISDYSQKYPKRKPVAIFLDLEKAFELANKQTNNN